MVVSCKSFLKIRISIFYVSDCKIITEMNFYFQFIFYIFIFAAIKTTDGQLNGTNGTNGTATNSAVLTNCNMFKRTFEK